jgi:cytochrome c oxidase assembly factor CtaG
MQWWCAATSAEWSWTWQPFPGVWLVVGFVLTLYVRTVRRPAVRAAMRPWHPLAFGAGLLVFWAMLDWPVGLLGAGYLLSVHTAQWVLLTLVAVPLLLLGIPPAAWPAAGSGGAAGLLRRLTHPGLGLAIFTATMALTHVPVVVDGLKQTQLGSFGIDLAWLVGAFALWWPVQAPDTYVRISPPLRIGYLFLATIPPTVPAAFMIFADYPLYALYELAPRVHGIAAGSDQQVAGLIMKAGADPLIWIEMAIVFFFWQRAEEAKERHARALEFKEIVP